MYKWLNDNEIVSSIFENFNRRYSVYRDEEYKGIIWEYPWISMLFDYGNMGCVLIIGTKRLYNIFAKRYPELNLSFETELKNNHKNLQFNVIICEDLDESLKRLSLKIDNVIDYLKPFGKLIVTYRYSFEQKKVEVLNNLLETDLKPYLYQECDILPNDPKFEKVCREYIENGKLGNDEKTSIGLVLYKPKTIRELRQCKLCINRLWLDSYNQVIEYYTDINVKGNSIGLETGRLSRVFYLPEELKEKKHINLDDFCKCFHVSEDDGCVLLNELLINELMEETNGIY